MELEFDKEIDAILRKGRDTRGVLVGDDPPEPKKHVDADTIAAFAENALPARSKLLYIEHFADCGRCRKQLSHAIAMNREADAAAASIVSEPVDAAATPWYAKLFRTPNLAIAMGSLVLVFSGVLGFLVLKRQNETAANSAVISQATEPDTGGGPYFGEEATTNTNAAPANSAGTVQPPIAANSAATAANIAANEVPGAFGRAAIAEEKTASDDKALVLDGVTSSAPAPKPAAPVAGVAPPPPADQPREPDEDRLRAAEAEAGKDKKELTVTGGRKQDERLDRDATPRSLSKAGPSRAGPLQNQSNQANSNLYDMSVTRRVGGKTFANRSGAWYDTSYGGQSPIMIRRGSADFKKLDGGLRSIANELYGTVIVVWKGKAYRIN